MTVEGSATISGAILLFGVATGGRRSARGLLRRGVLAGRGARSSTTPAGATHRLLAWRVGSHEFGRVATVTGYDPAGDVVSSYARIGD